MGQSRRDKEWPRPRHVRHVWVRGTDLQDPPRPGLILGWQQRGHQWEAFVAYVDDPAEVSHMQGRTEPLTGDTRVVQAWIPMERLTPIRSDPNTTYRQPW